MKNNSINPLQIKWMPGSVVDPVGRVFSWNNNIYRAITPKYSHFFNDLIKRNVIKNLSQNSGLIDSEITQLTLKGYGLILKHKPITFTTYPFEWCGEMFRDAALLILNLSSELNKHNLELKDAHPYNVMFEYNQPKFIDVGSIAAKKGNKWNLNKAFRDNILYPLYAMADSNNEQVRFLLRYELESDRLTRKLSDLISLSHKISDISFLYFYSDTNSTIKYYHNKIKNIKLKFSKTEWTSYSRGDDYLLPFENKSRWFSKQKNVFRLLSKLKPATVLDLGSNTGWYSELAARLGSKVVATDIDEPSLNMLYLRSKTHKLPILPLLIDFRKSSASNITWPAASERLQCDLVLALALTHHLVFKSYLYFDTIITELCRFTRKWLIVEFVPPNDKYIKDWIKEEHHWYTMDNFLACLNKYFPKIEILDSAPYPRKLIFCTK